MKVMRVLTGLWTLGIVLLLTMPISAKVYINKEDALKLAFPETVRVERKTIFLTGEEVEKIEALSRVRLESKIFTYYVGIGDESVAGYAFLGSHIVRTKPVVYMVVINPAGSLKYVEILAFYEPEEYLPSRRWFDQFKGKVLDNNLWPKRGISAVSSATLSVNGITAEVRKILSIIEIKILDKRILR